MNRIVRNIEPSTLLLIFALAGVMCPGADAVSNTGANETQPTAAPATTGQSAAAPRERAIVERLQLSLVRGEIIWLGPATDKFFAVYRAADEDPPHGGLIINIAPGAVADARPVHNTLARSASAAGWTTLSVQPPLPSSGLEGEELQAQIFARLDLALAYLVERGIEHVIVVGDGDGAGAAMKRINDSPPAVISGFVGLGAWDVPVDGTEIPILDIAGTSDKRALDHQKVRSAKTRTRVNPIEILEIDGAGPEFYGYEEQVAKRIRGWLERATPGAIVKRGMHRSPALREAQR